MIAALILQLAIVAPVSSRDTAGHVDLKVGQTLVLDVKTGTGVKWSSGNPTVASITTKGVVTARARGYATITAAAGTAKATTRVCVTAVDQELVPWKQGAHTVTFQHEARLRRGYSTTAIAHVQLLPSVAWGPCVHWSIDSLSSVFARIDRAGVLHSSRSVAGVIATIGPKMP